jgi:hypothetical protein
MSTLQNLKDQVKRYFSSNTSLYTVVQGQPEQVSDLEHQINIALVLAANNARRFAEMRHDFSAFDVTGRATVVGGAVVSLDSVELLDGYGTGNVSMKSVRAVHTVTDDQYEKPLKVVQKQTEVIASWKRDQLATASRYGRSDVADSTWTGDPYAMINGRFLSIQPLGDYTIHIDGNRWADDYIHDDDTDFFLQKGFEFMQWQMIVEMNNMLLKFVPRQEGSLPAPTQARDIALENLIAMDSYSIAGNIYHDL